MQTKRTNRQRTNETNEHKAKRNEAGRTEDWGETETESEKLTQKVKAKMKRKGKQRGETNGKVTETRTQVKKIRKEKRRTSRAETGRISLEREREIRESLPRFGAIPPADLVAAGGGGEKAAGTNVDDLAGHRQGVGALAGKRVSGRSGGFPGVRRPRRDGARGRGGREAAGQCRQGEDTGRAGTETCERARGAEQRGEDRKREGKRT